MKSSIISIFALGIPGIEWASQNQFEKVGRDSFDGRDVFAMAGSGIRHRILGGRQPGNRAHRQ